VKPFWNIIINDVHQLYKHHPTCVKLTPMMGPIRELVELGTIPPGVTANKEIRSTVRA